MEIDIEKELKNLKLEREKRIKMFSINMNRIDGAESLLRSLDEKNKAVIEKKEAEIKEKVKNIRT